MAIVFLPALTVVSAAHAMEKNPVQNSGETNVRETASQILGNSETASVDQTAGTLLLQEFRPGFGGFDVSLDAVKETSDLVRSELTFRVLINYTLPEDYISEKYFGWTPPGKIDQDNRRGSTLLTLDFEETVDSPEFPDGTRIELELESNSWVKIPFEPSVFEIKDQQVREVIGSVSLEQRELPFTVSLLAKGSHGAPEEKFDFEYFCHTDEGVRKGQAKIPGDGTIVPSTEKFLIGTECEIALRDNVPGAGELPSQKLIIGEKTEAPDVSFEIDFENANSLKAAKFPLDQRGVVTQIGAEGIGEFQARYRIDLTNTNKTPQRPEGVFVDELAFPAGTTIRSVEFRNTPDGTPLNGITSDPVEERDSIVYRRSQIPGSVLGEFLPGEKKSLFVTVDAQIHKDALYKRELFTCIGPDPNAQEAQTPSGLQNSFMVPEEFNDLDGTDNNHACINLVIPQVSVEHTPRPGKPVNVLPNGSGQLEYRIHLRNTERWAEATVQMLKEKVMLGEIQATGNAEITTQAESGVVVSNVRKTIEPAALGEEIVIAERITLPPRTAVAFVIKVPITADIPRESTKVWERLGSCYRNDQGGFVGGVQSSVSAPFDADGPENNVACIPVQPPDLPTLQFSKIDHKGRALSGAEFTIYPDNKGEPSCVPVTGANPIPTHPEHPERANITLLPGVYHLVETKAPKSHSLLARPVAFRITLNDDGTRYEIKLVSESDDYVVNATGLELQIKNTLSGKLPDSGSHGPFLQITAGLLVISSGAFALQRRHISNRK
ncbi:MSCRAMM family protein [Corynebacterium freiburgense]|uniref:MSCRAMM family protein n=1 Tax=Corynebacterium freiburgense TaxID=556548 RepID=UPI00041ACB4A|nr:prealbumin-like fold domain-containing protein [Corynebacterium freiburgense]WJZ01445.1 hypothetical protein CFREI_00675 [Corynebacterium freiburgense]